MASRNTALKPRKEGVRAKRSVKNVNAVRFEIDAIHKHFQETLTAIEDMFAIADMLGKQDQCKERDNMWRAQIVFLAGAFDFFMHEMTKYGLTQMLCGVWSKTKKYSHLAIEMETVELGLQSEEDDVEWFYNYVNAYYSTCTMISHAEVKEQLNLLGISQDDLAEKVFYKRGDTKPVGEKLKDRLNRLFERRNVIAHQVDREHADATLRSIEESTVREFIRDISSIVNCLCLLAKDKDNASAQLS